jgi:hypothetical protein
MLALLPAVQNPLKRKLAMRKSLALVAAFAVVATAGGGSFASGFSNYVATQGQCAPAIRKHVLVNTDRNNAYSVTVREKWKSGSQEGSNDRSYEQVAGGQKDLGCEEVDSAPFRTYWSRTVVGEVKR